MQREKGVYTLPDLLHFRMERVKNTYMAFDEENSESPLLPPRFCTPLSSITGKQRSFK